MKNAITQQAPAFSQTPATPNDVSHPIRALAGYPIANLTADQLSRTLCERLALRLKTVLMFANTNFIVQCRPIKDELSSEPVLIANDGIGIDLAARMIHGCKYRENLNGTDFVPLFLQHLTRPCKLFLLGGLPGVAATAGEVIARRFGHEVVGHADGYTGLQSPSLIQTINASTAEIVLVALGNPMQERWMLQHSPQLEARLLIGVGALLDFLSGDKQRAPAWVRRLRCEWLFRLFLEPRRMLKRYSLDVLLFFILCIRYRKRVGP